MSSHVSFKREAPHLPETDTGITPRRSKRRKTTATSSDNITVRLMKSHEINEVLRTNLEGLLEYCVSDGQRKTTMDYHDSHKDRNIQRMKKDCDDGYKQFNRRVWVAVSRTKVLGSMEIKPRARKPLKDRSSVQLDNVCVVPEHRGTGLAQRLLKNVESYCKDQGIGSIHLTTQDNLKRAVRFYEKEGYKFTHKKKWASYWLYYYKKDLC